MNQASKGEIRVLVVDDHAIVRKGIRALLDEVAGISVVAEAGDGAQAIEMAEQMRPDVILMDLVMPAMDGIQATAEILRRVPEARVLVLTSFTAEEKVLPAIKAGAIGYLLKDSMPEELVAAIRRVYRGEPSVHPTVARLIMRELASPHEAAPAADALSERETEVLALIAQGLSNKQIAARLVISETTVRGHVSSILGKLHLASRTQAALYAVRSGLAGQQGNPD